MTADQMAGFSKCCGTGWTRSRNYGASAHHFLHSVPSQSGNASNAAAICGYRIEFDADQNLLLAYVVRHTNKLGGGEKRTRSRVEQNPKDQDTTALHSVALATTAADDNRQQSGCRVVAANGGSGLDSSQPQLKLELPLWVGTRHRAETAAGH